jgi:hypothetical protein
MMPSDAKPLSVHEQNELLVMFAEVPQPPTNVVPRIFRVVTTGDEYETNGKTYVGSCILGGWFVAHVFEAHGRTPDPVDLRHAEDFTTLRQEQHAEQYAVEAR